MGTARVAAFPWRYKTVGYTFNASGIQYSASETLAAPKRILDLKNGSENVNHDPRVTLSVLVSTKFTVLRATLLVNSF